MINANNMYFSFGEKVILDNVSLSLLKKERICLVGHNGAGKSSLLKILAQEQTLDAGLIERVKNTTVAYLSQNPQFNEELTVMDILQASLKEHLEAIKEYENLCANLSEDTESKLNKITFFIEQKGGFDTEYLVNTVISRLGINNKNALVKNLSGGEKRRVDLARVLLLKPDVYLLDEPTNHLDIKAIEFLEEIFINSSSALLFISHDKAFIDKVATKIIELDKGKIYPHNPPFAQYLENKLVRELIEQRSIHKRERLMVNELAWLRAGTPARTTKQNARIDRAYELIDQIHKDNQNNKQKKLQLSKSNKRLGSTILELDNIGAKVADRVLFKDFSLKATAQHRYGIIGPNGVGKTTLLSILCKKRAHDFGSINWGKNTVVLEFDQHRSVLNPNETLKECLASSGDYVFINDEKIHIASYLERYLFSASDALRKVSTLSGGEQNRLMFAKLLCTQANCLLLDEPSNDLDNESLAAIEELILDYEGVVFVISHDRSFLDRICTHIIAFEPYDNMSKLEVYNGNYSDYLKQKSVPVKIIVKKEVVSKAITTKKLSYKEQKELENIQQNIEILEQEQKSLQDELLDPKVFKDNAKSQEKMQQLKILEQKIEQTYLRWQELELNNTSFAK